MKFRNRLNVGIAAASIVVGMLAPAAAADPTPHLQAAFDAARSGSGCPALQMDPRLNVLSQRVTGEIADYVRHEARSLPVTGEIPLVESGRGGLLEALRQSGYGTSKAKLMNGYGDSTVGGPGDNEAKAIKAAVLQGLAFETLSNCTTYTKYGLSALNVDHSPDGWPPFSVAVVIMIGDN